MIQQTLPTPGPSARATDPSTSEAAAVSAAGFASIHHEAIVAALRTHGPMGKDGIARVTGLSGVAVARRLSELKRADRAAPTGKTVASDTGHAEREWRAV